LGANFALCREFATIINAGQFASISQKPDIRTTRKFSNKLIVAVTRCFSSGAAIRCVCFRNSWMTLFMPTIGHAHTSAVYNDASGRLKGLRKQVRACSAWWRRVRALACSADDRQNLARDRQCCRPVIFVHTRLSTSWQPC